MTDPKKTPEPDFDQALDAYCAYMEAMEPAGLTRLPEFCAPDIHFRDPFNDTRGLDAYRKVLEKMFDDISNITFQVTHRARAGDRAYLRWHMTFRNPALGPCAIDGVTEIGLAPDGKITAHLDYWDAASQLYEKAPLLGPLMRGLRRRLSTRV